MRNFRFLLGAAALLAAACAPKASINGVLEGAPAHQVEVRLLDVNSWKVLDTVKTDASGAFRYKVAVEDGKPEFIYLFSGGTKLASLLLKAGDKVSVKADTLGNYTVEGSEDSQLLRQTEQSFADFASEMVRLDARGGRNEEMGRLFIRHYREATAFVLGHPYSLVNVPVLYESLNEYTPVFGQPTDAILFRRAVDSLKTVYPESRYVKALEAETVARENQLSLRNRIDSAKPADYPEVSLPGLDGNPVSLSGLGAKAVLLHFWNPADAEQKMFNLDVLMPIYERWHAKGLEIYSIGLSDDKPSWASVVRSQNLPWVNVCDGRGAFCPAVSLYNVSGLPWSALLAEGGGISAIKGEKDLEKQLAKILK